MRQVSHVWHALRRPFGGDGARHFAAFVVTIPLIATPANAALSWAPVKFRQVSYTRPFVNVVMNGKPFLMMVHSQASLYVQTTHANARAMGLVLPPPKAHFGISSQGHVSDLGATGVKLPSLKVADDEVSNVLLTVFEIPQDTGDGKPLDGMIGMQWLRARRVILDYDQYRLGIPATLADATAQDRQYVAAGFVPHKMQWDDRKEEYFVEATVNGVPARLGVSTVGVNVLNAPFVKRANIALGPVVAQEGGSAGSLVDAYLVKRPVQITLDGQPAMPTQPQSLDRDAYLAGMGGTLVADDGVIAADFMLANDAVIDFGTATLFLRSPTANAGVLHH